MLFLSKSGVPWAELCRWSPERRQAAVVAIRELDGQTYDWTHHRWVAPP